MTLRVDHVTIAGTDLKAMEQAFSRFGLVPQYGGPHSNGVTHMALLGFEDGSYIELISTMQPGVHSPSWGEAIAGNAGPCAWCARVQNIRDEANRLVAAGVAVAGPIAMSRQRPDGKLVEWELAYLGNQEAGATLPFIIQDKTPRNWRVEPTPGLAEKGLTGVVNVVLGVQDLATASDQFRRAYGSPEPQVQDDQSFGAKLAFFADTPVILATPLAENWLTARLKQFGNLPCAFLLGTRDLKAASARFSLGQENNWFGRRLAWFDPQKLLGSRLACIHYSETH